MIVVSVNWPVKNFRLLLMIAMEEFSTENEIPSVSYEKGLSLGKTAVAKNLI